LANCQLNYAKTLGDGLFLDFVFYFGSLQTTTNANSIMQNPWDALMWVIYMQA